jgi:hypothetical protein
VFGGERGVEPALAGVDAVEPDAGDLVGEVGVGQHALDACAGVVADERDAVEAAVDALHHRQRLVAAGEHPGPGVEVLEEEVALAGVCLVDQHLGGAARAQAADGGVDVTGEHLPEALPLLGSWFYVRRPGDAARAFHVG